MALGFLIIQKKKRLQHNTLILQATRFIKPLGLNNKIALFNKIPDILGIYYSHSMVAGGFELMSYTTLLTPFTLFIISFDVFCKNS